ncbi:MAG: DUF494 domain-containing protein [Gammaproteobacteria bacterium]|jgi:Smg protein
MKENVLDVLMYLFEHYVDDETEFDSDRDRLESHLMDAGFHNQEIDKAFDWLEGLANEGEPLFEHVGQNPVRIYTGKEMERLDENCRGFLMFLEQGGMLTPQLRERIIERVMALDAEEVDLEQLKWVVLMVLFNQPEQETAHLWLEDLLLDDSRLVMH